MKVIFETSTNHKFVEWSKYLKQLLYKQLTYRQVNYTEVCT